MDQCLSLQVDLQESIYALSDGLDLVGVDEVQHGKRVAFMAVECARALNWTPEQLGTLLYAGLLHDCGVSTTTTHKHLLSELEWDRAEIHCQVGHALLKDFPPLAELAPVILLHHTRWEILSTLKLDPDTASCANLLFLMDRVDALASPHYRGDILSARKGVRQAITSHSGTLFSPHLVDAFLQVSAGEAFWLTLEPVNIVNFLWEEEKKQPSRAIGFDDFRKLAGIFAAIVDAKSNYTLRHSRGVAQLARHLGKRLGLEEYTCDKLEIAGLLHDLGKLGVPDAILEKRSPLTPQERDIIHRHSFESFQILRRITGLRDVALWAAYHHETPDGQGYPFHIDGRELTIEARIIAVADVFQALAQERPYRAALDPREIMKILKNDANRRRLDRQVVNLVGLHLDECWKIALCSEKGESIDSNR